MSTVIGIRLYNNGFEIKGHADPVTCGELSILSWACLNTIYSLDEKCRYYTSAGYTAKMGRNPHEGYTGLIFDTSNQMALWVYEEFVNNLQIWSPEWPKGQVQIERVDADLESLVVEVTCETDRR